MAKKIKNRGVVNELWMNFTEQSQRGTQIWINFRCHCSEACSVCVHQNAAQRSKMGKGTVEWQLVRLMQESTISTERGTGRGR